MKRARTIAVAGLALSAAVAFAVAGLRRVQPAETTPVAATPRRASVFRSRADPRTSTSAPTAQPVEDTRDLVNALAASAHEQPALAVQRAAQLRDDQGRLEALHEALPHWLAQDGEAARSWLLSHIAQLPLDVALALVRDASAHDPQLGLSLAQQIPAGARPRALREVLVSWAGSAPAQAARVASQLLESEGRVRAIGEVARVWAEQAPADALRWASALDTREARREALFPIVSSWAGHDARAAGEALSALPDEGYKQRLVDTAVVHWASTNPIEARAWVEKLEPNVRNGAASALLETLLQREPARAAGWALELGGGAGSEIVEKTLTAWVARDADAALNWASEQPEARGRAQLMALASARFRLQDAPAAERWLTAHKQN